MGGNVLRIGGNLTNDGTFDMRIIGATTNTTFNGTANQTVSGTGGTTDFNDITIDNGGAASDNIVEITTSITSFDIAVVEGVLKLSTGVSITSGSIDLDPGGSFIINHVNAIVNIPNDIFTVTGGDFQLLNGTVSVGDGNDRFEITNGTATLSGGIFNINGRFRMSGSTTTIDGTTINIDPQGSSNLGNEDIFEAAGSASLTFTSGILTIIDPNAGTGSNAIQLVSGTGTKNFSGSTIQLGDGSSTTSGSTDGFDVNGGSGITLGNLIINNPSGTNRHSRLVTNNCILSGTLTFMGGKLETGTNTLTLGSSGSISGEATGSYLVGNLTTTRAVGTGTSSFGNIGFSIDNSGDDLGSVTVTRVSGTAPTGGTGSRLDRYWDISSTNPPSAGRNITFTWVSDDDGDADLDIAVVFKSTGGGSWPSASGAQDVNGSDPRSITAIGVTSFSLWTVGDANNPLPVELTSFTASVKNYSVHLNWVTSTEVSNYGFEVERFADKINWSKVAFVNGHGNSNSTKQYSYTDSKISSGKYYYRLKQFDTEGSFAYSKEIEVSTGELLKDFVVEQNFPNPFNPKTTIKFGFKEPVSAKVVIYNALGSEVTTLFNERAEAGKVYSIDFDGSQLASGIYYYSISGGNYNSVKKMILMK